jgi:SAM-dependent methyltransferase
MTTDAAVAGTGRVACRSCGSGDVTLRGVKRGHFLQRDFSFWHCPACDYLFVDPFPGYGVYDQAYYEGRGADPYVDYESEYRNYRATDRLAEFDDLWRVASGFISANMRPGTVDWLDFGCGAGGLLKFMRDKLEVRAGGSAWPVRVSGHDVGSYAERLARDDGFRMLSLAELSGMPAASFDVISMIEVIEHVEYPDPVFALASRLLRPGGLLLLTTGNVASPVARREGLRYAYLLPEIHVGYFTPRALEFAYARHGLVPVLFRYRGVVRFKVVKTLRDPWKKHLARLALGLPLAVRLVDGLYGTSRMPCARRAG